MPRLRFDRLFALTCLILLLASPRAALADPIADADKPLPNVETANPPAEADSKPTTEKPAGLDPETTLVLLRGAMPAASETTGESAGRNTTVEPSEQSGGLTPALVPDPVPTGKADQPATDPAAAGMQTPTPPAATPNANQPVVESSPTATPAPAASPNPDQPVGESSPAVVAKPAATPTSNSESSPTGAATPASEENPGTLTTVPKLPAAAGSQSDNPAAASDNPPASVTTAAPPIAPSEPGATTAAAAAIDPDAPIAEQLHDLSNGKFDRIIGNAKQRASIDAFYSARNYAPMWITDGKANARAKAAIAYLGRVWADGLDPADYPVPNFASLTDPVALAEAEVRLTTSVITYAHHAEIGRVHWSRVSGDIFYDRSAPEPRDVLTTLLEATDVGAALDAYEPHSDGYLELKTKLAELRGGHLDTNKTKTPKLNGRQSDPRIDIVLTNMERWRWLPHDLGKTYIIVNLPDFTLRVIRQGKQVWMTKIVVGKPATPTPIMSAQMKSITINPTWNVPDSIAANEYLPLLQQDPTILQRMGLRMSYNPDGTIHLSQPPGEQNALGQLRFNFPNKFLVYQHDSNQKYLFANERRAESHGCMRVQDPVKYAEVLLSLVRSGEGYSQDRIRRMFGNNEIDIPFPSFIMVHLTYQTAFVDDRGTLEFREDVYGRDQALLAILRGGERKVADIPVQRHDNPTRRQLLAIPDNNWGGWGGRGYAASGSNFFTRLFSGPPHPVQVPRQPVVQQRTYYQQ